MTCVSAGSDPGYRNYGYAIVEGGIRRKELVLRVHEVGMLSAVITNLTAAPLRPPRSARRKTQPELYEAAYTDQRAEFVAAWAELHDEYHPVRYTTERFQTRGIKGKSIECVSAMNAIAAEVAFGHGATVEMITASTWKNSLNRCSELTGWYGRGLSDHTVDSLWIAVYGVLKHYNLNWSAVPYTSVAQQLTRFART